MADHLKPIQANDRNDNVGKIFVGGLAPHTTNDSLKTFFLTNYGSVLDARVMTTTDKGTAQTRSRGFAFVKFEHAETVDAVLGGPTIGSIRVNLDGKDVDVKRIDEHRAQDQFTQSAGQVQPLDPARAELESRKIFIGGLPDSATNDSLREYFVVSVDPNIVDSRVMIDNATGKNRGFGYITFTSKEAVDKAIAMKDKHYLDGKWIEVKRSVARGQPGNLGKGANGRNNFNTPTNNMAQFGQDTQVYGYGAVAGQGPYGAIGGAAAYGGVPGGYGTNFGAGGGKQGKGGKQMNPQYHTAPGQGAQAYAGYQQYGAAKGQAPTYMAAAQQQQLGQLQQPAVAAYGQQQYAAAGYAQGVQPPPGQGHTAAVAFGQQQQMPGQQVQAQQVQAQQQAGTVQAASGVTNDYASYYAAAGYAGAAATDIYGVPGQVAQAAGGAQRSAPY